ncbi:MAG TPA: outer membrane beta-barrel protein [Nitrospiraceae bacterium]
MQRVNAPIHDSARAEILPSKPARRWLNRLNWLAVGWTLVALVSVSEAQDVNQGSEENAVPPRASPTTSESSTSDWHYGAYLDLSYIVNFNFPENRRWRSRTTTERNNELTPNMGLVYVRKDATESSRWGTELGFQGGYDADNFAFLVNEPKVDGANTLRYIHRANVSYLAPVGNGLTVTAGLFNSLIGYESLYAKDNFNYTRSWAADNTPYMMFGVNAKYPVNEDVTVTAFIINGYYHLSNPNDQPSYGGQVAWKPAQRVTVTNTLYYGPDQQSTSLEFWRLFSDNIVEWKGDDVTVALTYDIGTERILNQPGNPRTFAMAGVLEGRWHIAGPWGVALRPEFYWDRNGRWTGSEQFIKAVTTTAEYKFPYWWTNTVVRLEYRYDESTGTQGGFFTRNQVSPGVIGLTAAQHMLLVGILWTFDSP